MKAFICIKPERSPSGAVSQPLLWAVACGSLPYLWQVGKDLCLPMYGSLFRGLCGARLPGIAEGSRALHSDSTYKPKGTKKTNMSCAGETWACLTLEDHCTMVALSCVAGSCIASCLWNRVGFVVLDSFLTVEYHSLSFSAAVTSQLWSCLINPVALFICMLGFLFRLGFLFYFISRISSPSPL